LARTVIHDSFTWERLLTAPPERVWAAYADLALRSRWYRVPGSRPQTHELDLRVGGRERLSGSFAPSGEVEQIDYEAVFLDVVPGRRHVAATTFALNGERRWTSLLTLALGPEGTGTRLTHTEQFVLLRYDGDGEQDRHHLRGSTGLALNALEAVLG
jgi:uncharacterized protein YndB with AHSA1/START domain